MLAALKLFNDRRGICDHRGPVAMKQPPRQFVNGGAAFEENGLAIKNQPLRFSRDGLFFGAIAAAQRLVRWLEICARSARDCAAMRAHQHSFFLQNGEIAANGRSGNAEHADQVRSGDASLARENLADAKSPFFGQQAHESVRASSENGKQADCATNRGEIYCKSTKYVIFDKN